jgi:acetyl esterase/lipase
MSRVRVGLIGFGAIGQQVAAGIEAGGAGDVELVAILTRNPRIIELAGKITVRPASSVAKSRGAVPGARPTLVAYGSDENQPTYGADSRRLVEAVRARGGTADVLELEGMTHANTAHALGDATSPLFHAVMQHFIAAGMVSEAVAVTS